MKPERERVVVHVTGSVTATAREIHQRKEEIAKLLAGVPRDSATVAALAMTTQEIHLALPREGEVRH